VAGEGAATGAELYVGHGTVWVNGDNGYIAMQVSGLEVLPGAGLTDSGIRKRVIPHIMRVTLQHSTQVHVLYPINPDA